MKETEFWNEKVSIGATMNNILDGRGSGAGSGDGAGYGNGAGYGVLE